MIYLNGSHEKEKYFHDVFLKISSLNFSYFIDKLKKKLDLLCLKMTFISLGNFFYF